MITRYDLHQVHLCGQQPRGEMRPTEDGEWVLFDDAFRACAAKRQGSAGGNDAADCNWPFCGCDPHADKVIAAIEESGFRIVPAEPTQAMVSAAMRDFDTPFYDDLERIYRCMVGAVGESQEGILVDESGRVINP